METRARAAKHPRSRALLGLLAFVLALGACKVVQRTPDPPYVLEIEAQNRRLEEAFRAGNLLGVADLYADDAEILDAHGTRIAGRAEIDEYWSAVDDPVEWKLSSRRIRGSEAVAYEVGTSEVTTGRAERHTAASEFLVVWRRAASGEWRIALDAHWPVPGR